MQLIKMSDFYFRQSNLSKMHYWKLIVCTENLPKTSVFDLNWICQQKTAVTKTWVPYNKTTEIKNEAINSFKQVNNEYTWTYVTSEVSNNQSCLFSFSSQSIFFRRELSREVILNTLLQKHGIGTNDIKIKQSCKS